MTALNPVLVVGAGFAGAVYARTLAEAGYSVKVIDRRDHIGGNAFDFVDENGIRIHRYGPHLFHTNIDRAVEWLLRFGTWVPYTHRVRALLEDGRFVPLPVNLTTINALFGLQISEQSGASAFLESISDKIASPSNAAEYLYSRIGQKLTDLFFRPYTKKMWSLDLEDMDHAVVRRLPIRYDFDDRYFPNDRFQLMPRDGYSDVFARIFDHRNIKIELNTEFTHFMERDFLHCFNSMPIDVYFDQTFGELPYRSIRFHTRTIEAGEERNWSVTNFTNDGRFTRETWWHLIPGHLVNDKGVRTITMEEPCDYKDNHLERYYPVKAADGRYQRTYQKYRELSSKFSNVDFIGRCGTYQYLDMDQVINQSLQGAERWLTRN